MMMSARSPQNGSAQTLELFPHSSLGAPPAKTSPAQTPKARASKASGRACSSRPCASSERVDLVGSLLRTALTSELAAQTGFSVSWRRSATPAGRSWLVATRSERTTNVSGHGSSASISPNLPTPRASDASHGPEITKANTPGSTGVSLVTTLTMGALATPRKTDADRGFRGDVLAQLQGQNNRHAGMMSTPRASDMKAGGHGDTGRMGTVRHQLQVAQEGLPTPTKRDKRMDRWSPAYDKRKSPTMDAILDGAMTDKAPDKWAYARQIAALLSSTGLTGPSMTLPVTYGWMMGYPPGWLARALRSAVLAGRLPLASSSKRSATPCFRKSRKRSAGPSSESSTLTPPSTDPTDD